VIPYWIKPADGVSVWVTGAFLVRLSYTLRRRPKKEIKL
jgi:hypothetical protein